MTVTTTISSVTVLGNGVATSFAFNFKSLTTNDILVTRVNLDNSETVLSLDVDYTVTLQDQSGTVTYPVSGNPLPTGESLRIERAVPVTQTTDFTNQGSFFAETHEDAFDKLTMISQDTGDRSTSNSLRLDAIEALAFSSSGEDTVFSNLAALKAVAASSLRAQQVYRTRGYYSANDGGSTTYIWDSASVATANDGSIVQLDAGGTGRLIAIDKNLTLEMFGCVGSGLVNDATRAQAALNAASTDTQRKTVYGLKGATYRFDSTVTIPAGVRLDLDEGTITKQVGGTHNMILLGGTRSKINNAFFDGQRRNGGGVTGNCIMFGAFEDQSAHNIRVYDDFGIFVPVGATRPVVSKVVGVDTVATVGCGETAPDGLSTSFVVGPHFTDIHSINYRDEVVDVNTDTVDAVINNIYAKAGTATLSSSDAIDIGGDTCTGLIISNVNVDLDGRTGTGILLKTNGAGSTTTRISISSVVVRNGSNNASDNVGIQISTAVQGVTLQGIHIDSCYYGVLGINCNDIVLSGFNITNAGLRAISIDGDNTTGKVKVCDGYAHSSGTNYTCYLLDMVDVMVTACTFDGGTRALMLEDIVELIVNAVKVTNSSAYGLFAFQCDHVTIASVITEGNTQENLALQLCDDFTISGQNSVDVQSGYFATIINTCIRGVISGLTGSGAGGIRFTGTNGVIDWSTNNLTGFTTQVSGTTLIATASNDGGRAVPFTPTVDFDTTGDFVPSYTVQEGVYTKIGNLVTYSFEVIFDTNAYTTAAGNLFIPVPIQAITGGPRQAGALVHYASVDFDGSNSYQDLTVHLGSGSTSMQLRTSGDNTDIRIIDVANLPASTSGIQIAGTISYIANI